MANVKKSAIGGTSKIQKLPYRGGSATITKLPYSGGTPKVTPLKTQAKRSGASSVRGAVGGVTTSGASALAKKSTPRKTSGGMTVNKNSVLGMGYGPISAKTLASKVASGAVKVDSKGVAKKTSSKIKR